MEMNAVRKVINGNERCQVETNAARKVSEITTYQPPNVCATSHVMLYF